MYKRNIAEVRKGRKPGILSHILLQKGDHPGTEVAVAWVEVEPGAVQNPHCHAPAQVYLIIAGVGRVLVDDEEQDVQEGDLVYVPPNAMHGVRNTGTKFLTYVSVATPSSDLLCYYPDLD